MGVAMAEATMEEVTGRRQGLTLSTLPSLQPSVRFYMCSLTTTELIKP